MMVVQNKDNPKPGLTPSIPVQGAPEGQEDPGREVKQEV